ncbi:hypothetical protein AVEN_194876-1 [Araneus ventricosus]|uniref:Uncharacterized protein n=1 Tax=Araneus ventricosus TaxID=182803 RepID=A0A4Y2B5Q5_ARAVE|nr:hypothetical protein AVEN_194876-1 [Araneus ventricosus]
MLETNRQLLATLLGALKSLASSLLKTTLSQINCFFTLIDSEVPVPENTTQDEANSSSEVLINTPQINLQPAEPGTSSVKPPSPTKHLHKISPIPRLCQVSAKHIIKKTSVLLTLY